MYRNRNTIIKMNKFSNINEFFQQIPLLENKKNKRVAVYTALFGNSDELKKPKKTEKEIDYFCFTNNPSLVSDKWNIILLPVLYYDPRMSARSLKILSHKILNKYDYSVWIDATCTIYNSINDLIFNFGESENIISFNHPNRKCIYKEARICQLYGYDKFRTISKQIEWYKKLEYPKNNGLASTAVLIRRNNENDVKVLNEEWWNIVSNYSNRDQLSFNFIIWKYGIKNHMKEYHILEKFFYITPHKHLSFYFDNGKMIKSIRSMFLGFYRKLRG